MKIAPWWRRAVLLLGAMLISVSCAGPAAQTLSTFPIRIQSRAQAENLGKGSAVALACVKCQNVNVASADEKRRFLSWFSPYEKHGCARCGGKLTARPASAGGYAHLVHTCTRCGNNSAFTCATHSFHARPL